MVTYLNEKYSKIVKFGLKMRKFPYKIHQQMENMDHQTEYSMKIDYSYTWYNAKNLTAVTHNKSFHKGVKGLSQ